MKEKLKILIANDDGIRSEGIAKLARAAASFGTVWVAAPEHQCSGMSVRLTISEKSQMAVYRYDFPVPVEAAWSVDGTPADCVKVALNALLLFRPDIVLSGINDGLNAGLDVAYSGTIGAATEAAMHGVPAIAFSMRDGKSFDVTDHYLCSVLGELLEKPLGRGEIWNVNFPTCPLCDCRGILYERFPVSCGAALCAVSAHLRGAAADTCFRRNIENEEDHCTAPRGGHGNRLLRLRSQDRDPR